MPTTSRPALRWAVPAGVTALVLGGAVLGPALTASAGVELPERTPEQLLTDLQTADVDAFSGTVAHHADLGQGADGAGADPGQRRQVQRTAPKQQSWRADRRRSLIACWTWRCA